MKEAEHSTTPIPCPLCGGFNDYILARSGYPGIKVINVICRECGLVRINPRPSHSWYERFYKEEFFNYLDPYNRPAYIEELEQTKNENYITPTKKFILPFIRDYIPRNGNVLDIGAGFGQTLYLIKKEKNANVVGVEPDPYSRQIASQQIGIELLEYGVDEFLIKNKSEFDFIILSQTFEHLLDPLSILKNLARILKKDGVIFVGVPNTYNPLVPINLFFQIAHTFNYTPYTMKKFADYAGLKIIRMKNPRTEPGLEVLLAHKKSLYSEIPKADLEIGSDWKEVVSILRRKKLWNVTRGAVKRVFNLFFGKHFTEKIKTIVDQIINYRY